jgi:hypothetical protein
MCGSMTVSTHQSGARESKPLLWADDVYNALPFIAEAKVDQTKVLYVLFEGDALGSGIGFLDEGIDALVRFTGTGGNVLSK